MNIFSQPSVSYCPRLFIGLSLFVISLIAPPAVAGYYQNNLVTDDQANLTKSGYAPAANVDQNLVNPWGISQGPTSPFWVSNNGARVSSLYNGSGTPSSLVVSIPGLGVNLGHPTGQVFNADTASFIVSDGSSGSARFLFATEEGIISGWNPGVPPPPTSINAIMAGGDGNQSASGASYKGLAIDNSTPGSSMLYAADFGNGQIDVFDKNFNLVNSFVDADAASKGYVPFNIQNLNGNLYVAYASKANGNMDETAGPGLGIVDIFDTQGNFTRLIDAGGVLDAPWGLALAPSDFGVFSNDLLVGNFGDGRINAFDPMSGKFLGTLSDANDSPIVIDGLWGLAFGNGANGTRKDTLYFTAGINDEEHGLFGSLSVPEPATLPMMLLGLVLAGSYARRFTL